MKRFLISILILIMMLSLISCSNEKTECIKIGVIDSCISNDNVEKFNINNIYSITYTESQNNMTHGSIMIDIISQNASNYELFYCSALKQNCTGEIQDIVTAINWCIKNDVDIISMSFSTLQDNSELKEAINNAISNNIIVVSACINNSDENCYPAMYEGVISVSEGSNQNATIIIKDKTFKISIEGHEFERTGTSVLTAYVCGKISSEMSKGKEIDEIMENLNFD